MHIIAYGISILLVDGLGVVAYCISIVLRNSMTISTLVRNNVTKK